jgi:YD repeat-containing protein
MGYHLYELPSGQVQMYLRDPGGNLVEINWPDAATLRAEIRGEVRKLADVRPQDESNRRGVLYLDVGRPLVR